MHEFHVANANVLIAIEAARAFSSHAQAHLALANAHLSSRSAFAIEDGDKGEGKSKVVSVHDSARRRASAGARSLRKEETPRRRDGSKLE